MVSLSDNFTLAELTHTQHRDITNVPDANAQANLRDLARGWLEPLRARWGTLYVSSGFRCVELNTLIGGAPDSAHLYGCAADVVPLAKGVSITEMLVWIRDESGLVVDQVIDEKGAGPTGWLHVSHKHPHYPSPRQEFLSMRGGTYTPIV